MKVVHIHEGAFSDGWNYQENFLTKWHHIQGHDVAIVTSKKSGNSQGRSVYVSKDKYDYINSDGVRVIRLDEIQFRPFSRMFRTTTRMINLYETLEKLRPDILFVHNIFYDVDIIAKYLKANPHVTAYVDNHIDFSNSRRWLIKRVLMKLLPLRFRHHAVIVPYVRKFYGVLPARVDYLKNIYRIPAEKCELLLMGADDDLVLEASKPEVKSEIRSKYNIKPDDFLIMTGGKIDNAKTQVVLLMQAVKNIDAPRVKLIIFGSVDDNLREKVSALSDGVKVQYIGWVNAHDTYKYFAASDLAIFPGRHSVFWEQVAGQGIPMICKEWEGTKHVDLGGNVKFLTHDSTEQIQAEIQRLLDNPEEYTKMKAIAEREGMKKFSYRDIARQSIDD